MKEEEDELQLLTGMHKAILPFFFPLPVLGNNGVVTPVVGEHL